MSKTLLQSASGLVLATLFLSSAGRALANPAGGQVVLGSASIGQTSPTTLQVDQKTKVVIVNWSSFNIAKGETTRFNQPGADALAVNRIGGGSPSQILGSLLANGRIVLINGDGIVFGPNARINTGSFLATTSDASNADIASGRATFDKPGNPNAMIVNQGTINATGGMVGLIAPAVRNDGIVSARLGSVTLGASNVFTVDFTGDGLISFPVDPNVVAKAIDAHGKPVEALVVNNGRIEGSTVLLSARAAHDLVTSVISTGGKIAATAIHQVGGNVVLDGGYGGVSVTGAITASGNTGGNVTIAGNSIALKGATIDASGTNGGGRITVGGWTTNSVKADAATMLDASATASGNGGHISYIGALSHFFGTAKATGGTNGGNGGSVETSGHTLNINGARVDTSAPKGRNGSWLLDPDDYTIDNAAAATIAANLASSDVTIQTTASGTGGNGDIFVNASVSWSSANSLTLSAYRSIAVNANLANSGGAAVNLRADNSGTGTGTVSFASGINVSTSGALDIFYNPSVNPAGSIVNTASYVSPTENFSSNIAGGGTLTAYMLVNTVYDLQNIQNNLAGTYALGRDIDASETATWNAGAGFSPIPTLAGTIDGNGHRINNLTIDRPSSNGVGLFASIGSGGTVIDIGLLGGQVTGRGQVGALAGLNNGTITLSHVSSAVDGSGNAVGGLVGSNNGTITQSYSIGAVNGGQYVGGLVGENYGAVTQSYATGMVSGSDGIGGLAGFNEVGTITQSYATGAVGGVGQYDVGGLVGMNMSVAGKKDGAIIQSYATGTVSGTNTVGGLVGANWTTITRSYATGAVNGSGYVGGLLGWNIGGSVTESYWDTQSTYQSVGVGVGGGGVTGLTTAQARTLSSYAGWDFTNDWYMIDGETRPFGRWEYSTTITNAHQLQLMAMDLTASYTLANDIDLRPSLAADANGNYPGMWGANGFAPIGYSSADTTNSPLSPTILSPIVGVNATPAQFTGTFDGQDHTISNLVMNNTGANNLGLFSWIGPSGMVQNVGLVGGSLTAGGDYQNFGMLAGWNLGTIENDYSSASVSIGDGSGGGYAGGLVGWNWQNGTISNSYTTGNVAAGNGTSRIGGLVGWNGYYFAGASKIIDSYATGNVTGGSNSDSIGGLVGGSDSAVIQDSYATGNVTAGSNSSAVGGLVGGNNGYWGGDLITSSYASGDVFGGAGSNYVGGLVGVNLWTANIAKSYAIGSVTGDSGVGGLVGWNGYTNTNQHVGSTIATSFASGVVSGLSNVGGLVGYNNSGTISQSYWDTTTSGYANGLGGNTGGSFDAVGLTSAQARTQSSYVGWDFTNDWFMIDGETRPFLRSEWSTTITNAHQLQLMVMDLTANYTLANDIDLGPALSADANGNYPGMWGVGGFVPIGNSLSAFVGTLNGEDHSISNLTINRPLTSYVGLFGISGGTISDIGIVEGTVSGIQFVGGLVGYNYSNGTITSSFSSVAVIGNDTIGGLVGFNFGTVTDSYATGSVSGTEHIGGLAGWNAFGVIVKSYATGGVSGEYGVGGLVGTNGAGNTHESTSIIQSFATGAVRGKTSVGGLVGEQPSTAYITQSYWDTQSSGQSVGVGAGDASGTTSLTSVQARTQSSYVGWDFTNDWFMIDGETRPFGRWEYSTTITNAHQLQLMAMNLTASYTLANDIDLGPALAADANGNYPGMWGAAGFVPVGNAASSYEGAFNGDSHVISNLTIARQTEEYVGLFGDTAPAAIVEDLALSGSNVFGQKYVGTLVGYNSGTILRSSASGSVTTPFTGHSEQTGGLVGYSSGAISYSQASTTVSGDGAVGGLVGVNDGSVVRSSASGDVSGAEDVIGGLVGGNGGTITQSYASGSVVGYIYQTGGLVGRNTDTGIISDSYATGSVAGPSWYYTGGLIGENDGVVSTSYSAGLTTGCCSVGGLIGVTLRAGTAVNSYWDINSSGQASSAGGTGLTTAQLTSGTLPSGFDHAIWGAQSGHYPCLLWQSGCITATSSVMSVTYSVADASSTYGMLATLGAVTLTGVLVGDAGNVTGVVTLYDSSNGAVALSDALNAGFYAEKVTSLTGSAATNYTIAVTGNHDGTLTINPAPLTVAVNSASRVYGDANPAFGATITGFVLSQDASVLSGLTFSTTATTASGVGNYAITSSGGTAANYIIATRTDGTLTVTARPITIAADDLSRVYGNANPPLTYSLMAGSLVNGDTLSGGLTTAATTASDVGTYAITQGTLAASANYTLTFNPGTLTVTARPITVAADDLSRVYGDANPPLTYSLMAGSLVNGDTLSGSLATTATTTSNVGTYAITQGTLAASTNYTLTFDPGTLTVTARPITIAADDLSRVYGDANPPLTYSLMTGSLVNGDTLSGSLATTATVTSDVGTYAITQGTLAASANYTLTFDPGTLTVTARPITIAADDLSRVYGDANPPLTYSLMAGSLVNGDTLSGSLATTATATSDVGTYAIAQGTLAASANYTLTFDPGTLTVTARPITIAADDLSRVYGDANPPLTYSLMVGSLVNGDTLSGSLTTTATATSNVGTYGITQGTLAASANYALTFDPGTLTVTARPITIAADDLSRVYGDANPPLTYSLMVGSLVNGDTLSGSLATTATVTSDVGTYAITQGTLAASANYTLTFNPGTLTVTARPITVAADDLSRVYGDANPPLTYSLMAGSLVNGDTLSGGLTTAATTASDVGSYAITQGTLAASANYTLTFDPGTLTLTPAPLTLAVADASRYFLAPNPPFLVAISGFKLGQDASLVSGLSVTTTANLFSLPGTYPIVAVGGMAPNYVIATRFDGTLTIERRVNPRALGVISTLNFLGALGSNSELTSFDWRLLRWFELFDIEQLLIANDNDIACLVSGGPIQCGAAMATQ